RKGGQLINIKSREMSGARGGEYNIEKRGLLARVLPTHSLFSDISHPPPLPPLPLRAAGFSGRDGVGTLGSSGSLGFVPPDLTTLPHFSISSVMSLPKAAGEPGITVPPKSASRALSLESAKPTLISMLSLSTISLGVFLGAATPYQALAS